LEKELQDLKEDANKMKVLIGDQSKKIKVYGDQVAKHKQTIDDNKNRYRQRISALQSQINELKKKGGVVDNKDLLSKRNYVSSGRAEKVQKLNQEMAKDAFEEHELLATLKDLKAKIGLLQTDVSLVDELLVKSDQENDDFSSEEEQEEEQHESEAAEVEHESLADMNIEKEEREKKISKIKKLCEGERPKF